MSRQSAKSSSAAERRRRLVHFHELPPWAHDNEFIRSGYRAPGGTKDAWKVQGNNSRAPNGATLDSSGRGVTGTALEQRAVSRRGKANGNSNDQVAALDGQDGLSDIQEHSSFTRCWKSVWLYAHNETVNIHTHLWGAVVAIIAIGLHILGALGQIPERLHPITHHAVFYPRSIIPVAPQHAHVSSILQLSNIRTWWSSLGSQDAVGMIRPSSQALDTLLTLPSRYESFPWIAAQARPNDWKDLAGFATFLIGALTVMSCSATFHTVACHSQDVSHSYNKLDYIGIVAMIVGSFLPMLHYGFYCHPHLQLIYTVGITSLGAFAIYTVLSRKYATPAYRPVRTSVFVSLGLSAVFPVAHILSMYGHQAVSRTMGLDYLVAGGALYIIGASLYVARVPERFAPGTFDYIGASHQIFHVLILAAAFCHYVCIRQSYTFWHTVEALSGSGSRRPSAHYDVGLAVEGVCAAFEVLRHAKQ